MFQETMIYVFFYFWLFIEMVIDGGMNAMLRNYSMIIARILKLCIMLSLVLIYLILSTLRISSKLISLFMNWKGELLNWFNAVGNYILKQ